MFGYDDVMRMLSADVAPLFDPEPVNGIISAEVQPLLGGAP